MCSARLGHNHRDLAWEASKIVRLRNRWKIDEVGGMIFDVEQGGSAKQPDLLPTRRML